MSDAYLKRSAQLVQDALRAKGLSCEVKELPDTTRSAKEAAKAIGCEVAEIAKSLVFRNIDQDVPVLVIASGPNRVDEAKISEILTCDIAMASPDYVRESTGFAIGGVPPLGHKTRLTTLIDQDLMSFDKIWAAAGTPFSVFMIEPHALVEATQARIVEVQGSR